MRQLIVLCFVSVATAALIPEPFVTEPEPLQRIGHDCTHEYFGGRLIGETQGVALLRPQGTAKTVLSLSLDTGRATV